MPLHVSSICAHHQEVKIALHSLGYHHTETSVWSKMTKIQFFKYEQIVVKFMCEFFGCDYCVMQFWPPDDEHMCLKNVEAWNKLIVKYKFCASSWLITEINILRCTVSKTSNKYTSQSVRLPADVLKRIASILNTFFITGKPRYARSMCR